MTTYKRIVCWCLALASMLIISEICAFIIDESSPYYPILLITGLPVSHEFIWFFIYTMMTLSAAEAIANPKLREYVPVWGFILFMHFFWIFSLFVIDSLPTALSALLVLCLLCIYQMFGFIKKTYFASLALLPVAAWYTYLLTVNFILLLAL